MYACMYVCIDDDNDNDNDVIVMLIYYVLELLKHLYGF